MKLKFYKEDSHWYVDIPDYPGTKAELEMVDGADDMLDYVSKGYNTVTVSISENPIAGYNLLQLKDKYDDDSLGAFYYIEYFNNERINLDMWLCPVMLHVFGKYPENLYLYVDSVE